MEGYGGEIGQKMRSAVKAKLVELGSGKAGYIDDELPDYVMIMVANKRSKQQMCTDLNLFLGEQTELFVSWLHEVLHKLEEVTLPVANTSSKKQKGKSSKDKESSGKKDKKSAKKDKKSPEPEVPTTTTAEQNCASFNTINDVFAEELLEKAKKSLDEDVNANAKIDLKKKKTRKNSLEEKASSPSDSNVNTDDFDIPTISEISSTTEGKNKAFETIKDNEALSAREKDLAELALIQKQIEEAKKHLKAKGELPKELLEDEIKTEVESPPAKERESIDRDFLNLKEEDALNDFLETTNDNMANENQSHHHRHHANKSKSPIVFDLKNDDKEMLSSGEKSVNKEISGKNLVSLDRDRDHDDHKKRPVHNRLGLKNLDRSSRSRKEQELYIPAHRRRKDSSNKSRDRERDRDKDRSRSPNRSSKISPMRQSRDRTRNSSGNRRNYSPERRSNRTPRRQSRSPPKERKKSSTPSAEPTVRKTVGSRVIVAPAKKIDSSDDEDFLDKPVNSVIKITPRSKVSPSKQACKNLLLKAVADAQRSTILPKKTAEKRPASERLGQKSVDQKKSLFTKSYKNRLDQETCELFRKAKNLIIAVGSSKGNRSQRRNSHSSNHPRPEEEENIYENDSDVYEKEEEDYYEEENSSPKEKTQFVVTLDDKTARSKLGKRVLDLRSNSSSPLPQVSSSTSSTNVMSRPQRGDIRSRLSNKRVKENEDLLSSRKKSDLIEVYRKPKEVEKLIIQPDTDDEDDLMHKSSKSSSEKEKEKSKYSSGKPGGGKIKIEKSDEEGSTTPPLPPSWSYLKLNDRKIKSSPPFEGGGGGGSPSKKRRHETIKFDSEASKESQKENLVSPSKKPRRSDSSERSQSFKQNRDSSLERHEEKRKISTRKIEDRKYDNIPSLNSVPVDTSALKPFKTKERCIYHPNCTKNICEYYHPTAPCKAFPNCKFGDKCMYTHPKCKFDQACVNAECNFMHTLPRNLPTAPPISSHVVPVQSYKSISATVAPTTSAVMCKYYPNCTKAGCSFYHPKLCRYGKNCINKLECTFYHPEAQSCNKFKWVAQSC